MLADPTCGLTPLESYTNQGCGFQAFLWQATECTILVAGTYMKTGETLQSDVNATILARLLALVQATNHPFVLLGDWQNSPGSITSTVLPSKFHFEVLSPDASLLSGNVIDYALIHNQLASTTSLTTDWAVPWRPHALISYHFNIEEATKEYRQIQYFPPLPATPDIDFRPWTTYKSTAYELDLYGNPVNDTAQAWADWLSCTEQYLLQEHPWAAQGRGSNLRASHKPLAPLTTTTTWKRGRPAYWEQLRARFRLALQQPPQQVRATADAPQHWVGTPTWGQFLDTCHHWHKYKDSHAANLVHHTIDHQLQLAQQAANDESHLQYKAWLTQGYTKGLKGLFRSLRSSELAWERPYRTLPPDERMTQRLTDWGQLWQINQEDRPPARDHLQSLAREQARQLEQLTLSQLTWALRHLPDKACGPDAVTAQLLRTAPPLAVKALLTLYQEMEEKVQLPTQQQMHMVVMLPKNAAKERPITLTSLLYRVWRRLRKPLLDAWQQHLPPAMNHDRARPGATVLYVALERLLRQEVHRANGRHGVTCLMDMSTFYDTINLQRLETEALQLSYPPLMLEMALQVYHGPKAIVAEQEMTPFFTVTNGVPAGCPQAPLLAKAVLAPALQPWQQQHPTIHLSSWVDNVGFDTASPTALQAATAAVEAYRDLHKRLLGLGLQVNPKKTAFVATDKATERELKALLQEDEPQVAPVMRDLGIDHQAARKRRIPVMKQRIKKATARKVKLRSLKIPALKVRLRLHRGGVQPVALWGVESQGLAPRYRAALRHGMGKHLGHHTGGLLDVTYDIHAKRYIDPSDQVLIHHIKAVHHLVQAWPPEQLQALEQAWRQTYLQLQQKQYPWYSVRRPLTATIVYLLEWGWQPQELLHWSRPETQLLLAQQIDLQAPWWQIELTLTKEAQWQRTNRLASRSNYGHLLTGLDWHTYRQVRKKLKAPQQHNLDTWVQAAIHSRDAHQTKTCPICGVPATPKHILWLCKWHKNQNHDPMPAEWMNRITSQEEEPLWAHGWIPLEPQDARTAHHPAQGHGCWAGLPVIPLHQHTGWAFTLDATPSTYDPRSQMWVYGLCAHTMALGQLKRLGTLTGVPTGSQTKNRALLAGLVTLANQTTDPVKVIVQLVSVWEAWNHPKHRGPYMDLLADVPPQDYHRVTVLYISKNTRTPDAPANEPQLRRRQREAALAAWERAKTFYDAKQEEWQATLDQDHQLIYEHAVNRLSKIYADHMHYVHHKAPRHQGKHTKQYKKELVNRCRKQWADNHHHWEPHQRSGFQCRSCGIRMHQSLTTEILETRLNEDCPQMLIDDGPISAEAPAPLSRKPTRAQQIKSLLDQQPEHPKPGQHQLAETTGYLKCLVCGINVHKRVNEAAFNTFIQSPCVNQAYTQAHTGHPSHALWRTGEKVKCNQCGTHWNLDGELRIIATQALHKPCKGAGAKGSPPISDFFKKKPEQSSSHSSDTSQKPAAMEAGSASGPTPRRLSFPTALDEQEQAEIAQSMSALAMTPNLNADKPDDEEPGLAVDYF